MPPVNTVDLRHSGKAYRRPIFLVESEQGQPVSLWGLKGKVVYIDFWYNACGPCHALFDAIAPVKRHFCNNDRVVFLNISVDNKTTWKKALQRYRIEGGHAYTQGRERLHPMVRDYRVEEYPTTCLIGQDGKIAVAKPARSPEGLIAQIETALRQ